MPSSRCGRPEDFEVTGLDRAHRVDVVDAHGDAILLDDRQPSKPSSSARTRGEVDGALPNGQ